MARAFLFLALEAEDRRVEDGAVGRWKCVAAEEPAEDFFALAARGDDIGSEEGRGWATCGVL